MENPVGLKSTVRGSYLSWYEPECFFFSPVHDHSYRGDIHSLPIGFLLGYLERNISM